jgi:trimeric autotransporter adhesin
MASQSFKIFGCSCIIAVALSCPVAGISDADWVSIGSGIAGINGAVYAVVADDSGILYAGGSFTVAGRTCANNIARWDGSSWSALGSGITGEVRALAVDGSHNLFAGGGFDSAGGAAASHIARWNGSTWSALASGTSLPGDVSALVCDNSGNLFVGGDFEKAGGISVNGIAQWNGKEWSALGSGMDGSRFPFVRSLAIDSSGNIYAGGEFDIIGTIAVNHIAKWNGRAWSALGSGINRGYALQELPNVNALCVDGVGNLYAGGNFDTAGGKWVNCIARWNGTAWSALGSAVEGGILQAVSLVRAITINHSGDLYVCGEFTVADGFSRHMVAKWNGGKWNNLGSGMSYELYCLALDGTGNLYVGGSFSAADGKDMRSIAQWNGNAWSALGTGSYGTVIRTLAVDRAGKLYAGGIFTFAFGITANHIAQWNGSVWSTLGSGVNKSVYALAADSSGNLYAAGEFDTAGGIAANHIAKWDGSAWSALGSGTNGNTVCALAADGSGNLYAGGMFDTIGAVAARHIAKWDGSAWLPLGNGISASIYALALDARGNIHSPETINDTTLSVFKWDGTLWKSLGSGIGTPLNRPGVDTKEDALVIDKS